MRGLQSYNAVPCRVYQPHCGPSLSSLPLQTLWQLHHLNPNRFVEIRQANDFSQFAVLSRAAFNNEQWFKEGFAKLLRADDNEVVKHMFKDLEASKAYQEVPQLLENCALDEEVCCCVFFFCLQVLMYLIVRSSYRGRTA